VKFKDAELLGIPTIVIIGKGLANGEVEVRDRLTDTKNNVAVSSVIDHVVALCRNKG
jgi:prolyl-tRNA synthetase